MTPAMPRLLIGGALKGILRARGALDKKAGGTCNNVKSVRGGISRIRLGSDVEAD